MRVSYSEEMTAKLLPRMGVSLVNVWASWACADELHEHSLDAEKKPAPTGFGAGLFGGPVLRPDGDAKPPGSAAQRDDADMESEDEQEVEVGAGGLTAAVGAGAAPAAPAVGLAPPWLAPKVYSISTRAIGSRPRYILSRRVRLARAAQGIGSQRGSDQASRC